ncbi:glycosyltransferase [Shewanella sp. JM162201]|uniref:Glycosyltransferase n=1 Tax=Shewanella jiangmenensis TaxID=2837387 RepID=A0ABS5V6S0_9GAMM|nr:glycosyltransferase [Shewanella jiangmenensis]MBT1446139.1 glycosyltransferase [Shewanella jiangmenensis]
MHYRFVLRQLAPGGAELATALLGKTLQRRGHRVEILCLGTFSSEEASHWQGFDAVRAIDKKWLRQYQPKENEQLVLVDNVGHRHAPKDATIAIIHSDCCAPYREGRGGFTRLLNRFKARKRYRGREILVSRAMADELSHWTGRQHRVINNPFDEQAVQLKAQQTPTHAIAEPYLIHIGRISAEKRQDRLIRAYAQTPALHGHKLVFVGKEQDDSRPRIPGLLALATELGVADNLVFTGNLYNPFPLLKQASCLVLSSDTETMGYVLLEAMALNIPMVSTATLGGCEVLGKEFPGLVNDESQLGEVIAHALANPQSFTKPLPEHYATAAVTDAFEAFVATL